MLILDCVADGVMEVWKYGSMEVWKYGSMEEKHFYEVLPLPSYILKNASSKAIKR